MEDNTKRRRKPQEIQDVQGTLSPKERTSDVAKSLNSMANVIMWVMVLLAIILTGGVAIALSNYVPDAVMVIVALFVLVVTLLGGRLFADLLQALSIITESHYRRMQG